MTIPSTAVILAGGKGTRLGAIAKDLPKPMVEIGGKPLLELQILWLKAEGIKKVILLTGHLTKVIRDHFGNGEKYGVEIEIIDEESPLGTAGALAQLRGTLQQSFWVVYGDLLADLSLTPIAKFHADNGAFATLVVHPNDHPYDSDLVKLNNQGQVVGFYNKPHAPGLMARNLVNAAVYLLSPKIFDYLQSGQPADLAKDIFPIAVKKEKIMAWNSTEYLKDMGTPERLEKVRADYNSNKLKKMKLSYARPVVFLDRDGVIIEYVPEIDKKEDVKLRAGVPEAIRLLNQKGYLVIVATNQPMIAKGTLSFEELEHIHEKIETQLGELGAWVDRIYFCPHHPEKGFPGERPEFKIDCNCRKPKTGMLEEAAKVYNLDRKAGWMVGDTWRDVECGQKFGLRTVGLTGGAGYPYPDPKKFEPEIVCDDLLAAVKFILQAQQPMLMEVK